MAYSVVFFMTIVSTSGSLIGELTRQEDGDHFFFTGDNCKTEQCVEHGAARMPQECACVCSVQKPLFREDRQICVDDLEECPLATFGTGTGGVQRIPFVFLPLKGQIIHPSKEISFPGVKTPICAVSGAQYLTRKGFVDLRSKIDADVPVALFRDEGRTFLQWSGEDELRKRMSGRVVVVKLLCRDVDEKPTSPLDLRGIFTPCVAFRVQGTPRNTNVTEVQFSPVAHTFEETSTNSGLSITEYVAIGISSVLLGLIYVASVFLYLHIRKRRKSSNEDTQPKKLRNVAKKDDTSLTEQDIVRVGNERVQSLSNLGSLGGDNGVVKSNPLLNIGRQFQDKSSVTGDSSSNVSDSDDFNNGDHSNRREENNFKGRTFAQIHIQQQEFNDNGNPSDALHRDESGMERLPDEHVSIVETIEDREITRPVGTTRRKLYFNPAYFEPHLMADPPQAALDFLVKIREVIAIAKMKMAAKRFQPMLNEIPEEDTCPSKTNSLDIYGGMSSQRSGSVISLKRENSRKKSCHGCPGCTPTNSNSDIHNYLKMNMPSCSNCNSHRGDKQKSIRKWLDNIPPVKNSDTIESLLSINQNNQVHNANHIIEYRNNKLRKQNSFSYSKTSLKNQSNKSNCLNISTMSIKSEPMIRNYNLPLPDFHELKMQNHPVRYGQTVSKVEDIKPIGFKENQSGSLNRQCLSNVKINKFITGKNVLPDMVNEAVAIDHYKKSTKSIDADCMKMEILTDKNSPRCSSEKEIVNGEYESDSLERTSNKKVKDLMYQVDSTSSQASPSLSSALPLDEELTMRNAIYKTMSTSNSNTPSPHENSNETQSIYEPIGKQPSKLDQKQDLTPEGKCHDYSLVSEVYVNNSYNFGSAPGSPTGSDSSIGSRKLPITAVEQGCLTIEVKDSPDNYIKIYESDNFEPDTLDRKHAKQKRVVEKTNFSRKKIVSNLTNEDAELATEHSEIRQINSSTYKFKNTKKIARNIEENNNNNTQFESANNDWSDNSIDWKSEEGRILTLELRHSKRQRGFVPAGINHTRLPRPDIIPPLPPTDCQPIYAHPAFPPRRVEPTECVQKNANIRNTRTNIDKHNIFVHQPNYDNISAIESKRLDLARLSNRHRPRKASVGSVNTSTFVKSHKEECYKARCRRKKGINVEDSGYLSSDSTSSSKVQRKVVVPKIVSCSDSDDSENEARSESGAESVETHSVFFGTFRKSLNSNKSVSDKRHNRIRDKIYEENTQYL